MSLDILTMELLYKYSKVYIYSRFLNDLQPGFLGFLKKVLDNWADWQDFCIVLSEFKVMTY